MTKRPLIFAKPGKNEAFRLEAIAEEGSISAGGTTGTSSTASMLSECLIRAALRLRVL